MTSEDFRRELIQHANLEYDFFLKCQKIVMELTDKTHEILTENNITYFAMYGTLLGVCRDNGYIPWDYDSDLLIYIDDAEKVNDILNRELPEDMYVVSNLSDSSYRYNQIRVCKKGYSDNLHVDIYYCYGVPENKRQQKRFKRKAEKLYRIKSRKHEKYVATDSRGRNICRKALILRNRLLYFWIPDCIINKFSRKLLFKYPLRGTKYCASFSAEFHPVLFSAFGVPKEYNFNGHKIMIPENPDYILTSYFDDYKAYMPFEVRYKEYTSSSGLLRSLVKKDAL